MRITTKRTTRSGHADTGAGRMRRLLLALLIGMQILTLSVATLAWRQSSESVLRERMKTDLQLTTEQTSEKVARHLGEANRVRNLISHLAGTLGDRNTAALEATFLAALQANPEIAGVFIGRNDGSFLFVTRQHHSLLTKQIEVTASRRTVVKRVRSSFDSEPTISSVDGDAYDPRTRPWYQQAVSTDAPSWTSIYQFATSKRAGITTASRLSPPGNNGSVVGVDLELAEVNRFVARIKVSEHGTAMIVDSTGQILGQRSDHPLQRDSSRTDNESLATALTPSMEGQKVATFSFKRQTYALSVSPIAGSPNWFAAVAAPEADFLSAQRQIESRLIFTAIGVAVTSTVLGFATFLLLRRRVDRLARNASVDALTGALNRGRVQELAERRLERNRRDSKPTYVCLLDIDGFKQVNDTYGHPEGDRVIRVLSERLSDGLRSDDLFGRYGGEEFLVVLDNIDNAADAFAAIDRLRLSATAEPILLGDELVSLTLSAGLAGLVPGTLDELTRGHSDDIDFEELTRRADRALYAAKEAGRNRTKAYSPTALSI
jgi:diguanylate cyclase (GGDEF)-like protein